MAMLYGLTPFLWAVLIWTAVWKGIALWKAGRNNKVAWFVVMFILNTAGILPIIYLLFFQPKKVSKKKVSKKK